jgi:WD40 repeat protein
MKIKNRSFGFLNLNEPNKGLISCSVDRTIKLWNLKTFTCMRTLHGHSDEIWSAQNF